MLDSGFQRLTGNERKLPGLPSSDAEQVHHAYWACLAQRIVKVVPVLGTLARLLPPRRQRLAPVHYMHLRAQLLTCLTEPGSLGFLTPAARRAGRPWPAPPGPPEPQRAAST